MLLHYIIYICICTVLHTMYSAGSPFRKGLAFFSAFSSFLPTSKPFRLFLRIWPEIAFFGVSNVRGIPFKNTVPSGPGVFLLCFHTSMPFSLPHHQRYQYSAAWKHKDKAINREWAMHSHVKLLVIPTTIVDLLTTGYILNSEELASIPYWRKRRKSLFLYRNPVF